jgi:membrane protease subunit HflK
MGINIISVSLQDAEPPTDEVIAAFKNVENAKQNMDTLINEANAYYSTVIPAARTEADKIQKDAEAVKEARINDATGQTARFNEMFNEYSVNKDITETRMYLEAMEAILPGVKLYIDGGGDTLKILNLEDNANPQEGSERQ